MACGPVSFGSSQSMLKALWCLIVIGIIYWQMPTIQSHTTEFLDSRGDKWSTEKLQTSLNSWMGKDFLHLLREIYKPLSPGFDQDWTDPEGNTYEMDKDNVIHTRPLGSNVLILDVDNRIGTDKTQFGSEENFNFENSDEITSGALNHYMYAKLHGYDYKAITPDYELDMHPTWYKVPGMQEALRTHKYVVFMDADALFRWMELPLEWMLNYWNINDDIIMSAAEAPHKPVEKIDLVETPNAMAHWDKDFKYPVLNTGFVILQQHNKTDAMFDAWLSCPRNETSGCDKFAQDFPHEQGAFSNGVRLDPEFEPHVKPLKCKEANGNPTRAGCSGRIIEHLWMMKGNLRDYVSMTLSRGITSRFYKEVFDNNRDGAIEPQSRPPTQWKGVTKQIHDEISKDTILR